jgi:hypothetical protein
MSYPGVRLKSLLRRAAAFWTCELGEGGNSLTLIEKVLAIEAPDPSKAVSRLSLLTAIITSQVYLINAIFFGSALSPVAVYVIDRQTHLHLLSGQIGDLQSVFNWDGLTRTILSAMLVFIVSWLAARGAARLVTNSRTMEWGGPMPRYQLVPIIAANPTSQLNRRNPASY